MPYVSLDNLFQFWGNAKKYIDARDACYANWHRTETVGAVAFKPVPESDLEPVVDFMFTETGPASGEKGPDNPSTITGVSSASLWLAGKNISFTMPYYNFVDGEKTVNGVAFRANADGSVTVNGTATSVANCSLHNSNSVSTYGTSIGVGTWRLSGCPAGGSSSSYAIQPVLTSGYGSIAYDYGSGSTITVTKPGAKIGIAIRIASGYTAQNLVFRPQLELASAATEYEQPVEKQEYTIQLGDTYYGGSIDLSTGLMTVTWGGKVLTGNETFGYDSTASTNIMTIIQGTFDIQKGTMSGGQNVSTRFCSHYIYSNDTTLTNSFFSWGTTTRLYFRLPASEYPTKESFAEFLASEYAAGHPVTLVYKLNTPQLVQLTPQQIKALPALDKCEPRLNTLFTDADSIQVGYQKSPIQTERELTNAILALGGNE